MKPISWLLKRMIVVVAVLISYPITVHAGIGAGDENRANFSLAAAGTDNAVNSRTGATNMDSSMFSGRVGADPGTDRGISRDFDNRGIINNRQFERGAINGQESSKSTRQ